MKKYLSVLTLAAMAAYATSAFAQGTVLFNNGSAGLVQAWTSASDSTLVSVPKGGGQVQLYWAAQGSVYVPWSGSLSSAAWQVLNPAWKLENAIGFTTPAAGKFTGGTLTLNPLNAGGAIDYVVVGWTGNFASFDAALGASSMVGVSSKFTSTTGNPTTVPPGTATPIANSFGGMTLQPVPEPSTLALAGLGAAALLIFRRRK